MSDFAKCFDKLLGRLDAMAKAYRKAAVHYHKTGHLLSKAKDLSKESAERLEDCQDIISRGKGGKVGD